MFSGGLSVLASVAYLRPLLWLAWFLAISIGTLSTLLVVVLGVMLDPDEQIPAWMSNTFVLTLVLLAAPLTMHAARFAARHPPSKVSAAAFNPAPPTA